MASFNISVSKLDLILCSSWSESCPLQLLMGQLTAFSCSITELPAIIQTDPLSKDAEKERCLVHGSIQHRFNITTITIDEVCYQ